MAGLARSASILYCLNVVDSLTVVDSGETFPATLESFIFTLVIEAKVNVRFKTEANLNCERPT